MLILLKWCGDEKGKNDEKEEEEEKGKEGEE